MFDMQAALGAFDMMGSSLSSWIYIFPGLFIGIFFGAIPALGPAIAMALFLPLTYYMTFFDSMVFLCAIFAGSQFGVAVPAILVNVPGGPSAVATTFDGYPMAVKGLHNEALGLALMASTVGVLMSFVVLFLLLEPMANFAVKMGPSEMFMVAIWGVSLIAVLHGGYVLRGLLAGVTGLLMGTVGMNQLGDIRGTFGLPYLLDGFPTLPAMVGLFAASEMFNLGNQQYLVKDETARVYSFRLIWRGCMQTFTHMSALTRGSVIGVIIGILPGVGSAVANLMSYAETKRNSAHPETFGTGNPEGVVASEAANSSSEGGGMATLLALGIPSGGGTAIMMGAFAVHNVTGGPRFLRDHLDLVYAIIFNNFVQSLLLIPVGLAMVHLCAAVVRVPVRFIVPAIMATCVLGSYTMTSNMAGPVAMVVFSGIGWVMHRYNYPIPAMVVGIIMGSLTEGELVHTMQISGGEFSYLFTRPVTIGILLVFVLSLLWPGLSRARRKWWASRVAAQATRS